MQPANKIPLIKFIPGFSWFIVVCFLLFLPGNDLPTINWLDEINFDKVVHMSMFGLLVILFCWPFHKSGLPLKKKKKYFIIIALLFCIWGYCSELIQKYWAIGRDYEVLDWVADGLGSMAGYFFSRKKFVN